ncbi:MAG: LysM peptidoglycan-binding domain-containing protein, partial [Candidatus Limnocylindrales bacterium]
AAPSPAPTPTPSFPPSATPVASQTPPATVDSPAPISSGTLASRWAGLPSCPGGQACYLYAVKKGDTFSGIATYFGTTLAGLKALNPGISNPSLIHVGEQLKVPPPH